MRNIPPQYYNLSEPAPAAFAEPLRSMLMRSGIVTPPEFRIMPSIGGALAWPFADQNAIVVSVDVPQLPLQQQRALVAHQMGRLLFKDKEMGLERFADRFCHYATGDTETAAAMIKNGGHQTGTALQERLAYMRLPLTEDEIAQMQNAIGRYNSAMKKQTAEVDASPAADSEGSKGWRGTLGAVLNKLPGRRSH